MWNSRIHHVFSTANCNRIFICTQQNLCSIPFWGEVGLEISLDFYFRNPCARSWERFLLIGHVPDSKANFSWRASFHQNSSVVPLHSDRLQILCTLSFKISWWMWMHLRLLNELCLEKVILGMSRHFTEESFPVCLWAH